MFKAGQLYKPAKNSYPDGFPFGENGNCTVNSIQLEPNAILVYLRKYKVSYSHDWKVFLFEDKLVVVDGNLLRPIIIKSIIESYQII